jgi:hypothetical protein
MKRLGLLWAAFMLVGTSIGWAQTGPDSVCEINVSVPKPEGAKQFEAARKKHNEFHRTEKDKNTIMVWSVSTGPASGSYVTGVCGMTWKDMDGREDFDRRDIADIEKTLTPAIASNIQSYYILRKDLSLVPDVGAPTKMITVVHYFVKPSGLSQFTDAVKRINAAAVQSKYPMKPSRWYQLANGGEGPHYVVVTDRASWADMQGPDQTMAEMVKQVYGDDDKTMQNLRDAVDHTVSEMLDYRADLSYIPAKQ